MECSLNTKSNRVLLAENPATMAVLRGYLNMNKSVFTLIFVIATVAATYNAHADKPRPWFAPPVPDCISNYCCDDYCPKRPPCAKPTCSFRCPDYRPKCSPFAKPICRFKSPDYCKKCDPCPCGPVPPNQACGPRCCHAGSKTGNDIPDCGTTVKNNCQRDGRVQH